MCYPSNDATSRNKYTNAPSTPRPRRLSPGGLRRRGQRGEVVERPLDRRRDRGRRRDVRALRLEAVLVGHVAQLDGLALRVRVLVLALRDLRLQLRLAGVLQEALLLGGDAVAGLVAGNRGVRLGLSESGGASKLVVVI